MKKSRRDTLKGAMAGVVVLALAQMCAFAQTATPAASTTTTSMLLASEKPVAAAHAHGAATSAAAAAQTTKKPRGMAHRHVKNWALQPTGVANTSGTTVTPLDPNTIPKFVNQLSRPATFVTNQTKFDRQLGRNIPLYQVTENITFQQVLPSTFPKTKMYTYCGTANVAAPGQIQNIQTVCSSPGPTFEATKDQRIFVNYTNNLSGAHMFPVDPTIMAANPNNAPIPQPPFVDANGNLLVPFPPGYPQFQSPIVTVAHLHGGVTPSDSDGFPLSWFSKGLTKTGPTFTGTTFEYFNGQLPTMLWYHDHALGMTRLNLAAGLEGMFVIRDPQHDKVAPLLPSGQFEVPLMLSDRAFNTDGSIQFTTVGDNPDLHPYWDPEYFGNVIMVNGKAWPNMNVQRRQYRFRIVDGSNARFYNLSLVNKKTGALVPFIQVGADGSYLPAPVTLTSIFMAICERADILVDFSNLPAGTKVVMTNAANAPFPGGDPPDANTSVVMQFTVQNTTAVHPNPLPSTLITIPTLIETPNIGNPKIFTLNEQESGDNTLNPGNPVAVLIDGRHFDEDVTELPRVGTTEAWYFQNLTEDAHPIHIHLAEFQLEDRQVIDRDRFKDYWERQNLNADGIQGELPLDHPPVRINVETVTDTGDGRPRDFLFDPTDTTSCTNPDPTSGCPTQPIPPSPNEAGWKDVFLVPPFTVTRIRIRFAPQEVPESNLFPGKNTFPFDPTKGPGYVWHCHILDHEDNDMMRPMKIVNDAEPCLNCETRNLTPGDSKEAGTPAARYSTPATTPAHNHNGSMPTTEQKGAPASMPMPMPEQQQQPQQ
jgi:FtsP/CotA-like multicopper oxidase with cupredoxin domain